MLALQEDLSGAHADLAASGSRAAALQADTREQSEQLQSLLMQLEQAERAGQAAADDVAVLTDQLQACQGKLSFREKQLERALSAAEAVQQQQDLMSR